MSNVIDWLLADDNPAISYRTKTELLGEKADIEPVKAWLAGWQPANWRETRGLWYRYYITALAECGLKTGDIDLCALDKALYELETQFDCGCGDFMLLTALMKLGCAGHPVIRGIINKLRALPDGGFLCLRRLNKLKYTPKSCYKADLHALMFLAQCRLAGEDADFGQPLIDYFLKRDIFYKSSDRSALVLDGREGWRAIDVFYPFEAMRVGLQNIFEAFCALGYGRDERLREADVLLDSHTDDCGRLILGGTLTKSYLPKERVGRPSKWATFYAQLARLRA